MRKLIWLVGTALTLAGCSKGVEMTNASVTDVAEAAKKGNFITPGQWENVTEILSVDTAGMGGQDKRVAEAMSKAMVGRKHSFSSCVTEEQASKPATEMFAGKDNGDCRYDSFDMAGGKLSAVMTCAPKGSPAQMKMTMAGTYDGESYTVNVAMNTQGPAGQNMAFKARNTGKRTGACAHDKG